MLRRCSFVPITLMLNINIIENNNTIIIEQQHHHLKTTTTSTPSSTPCKVALCKHSFFPLPLHLLPPRGHGQIDEHHLKNFIRIFLKIILFNAREGSEEAWRKATDFFRSDSPLRGLWQGHLFKEKKLNKHQLCHNLYTVCTAF